MTSSDLCSPIHVKEIFLKKTLDMERVPQAIL